MDSIIILTFEYLSRISNVIITISPLLLPSFCIISLAIFYAIKTKKKVSQTFFLSIFTLIIILFISGLLNFRGSLILGYSIIIGIALVSSIYSIKRLLGNRELIRNTSLLSGFFIYLLFLIVALFLNYQRMFWIWDEFSFWGASVKGLYVSDALVTHRDSMIYIKTYIPGLSLFQYFLTRPFPQFLEFPAYIASNLLFFSLISSFVKRINLRTCLFILFSLLIPLVLENDFYSSLYVDAFLGIFFGFSLLSYYNWDFEKSTFGILMLSSTISMLTLTKDMGFIFALIVIAIIFLDSLIFKRDVIKKYVFNKDSGYIQWKRIFFLLIPPILILGLRILWSLHLKILHLSSMLESSNTFSIITTFLKSDFTPAQSATITIFKSALSHWPIYPSNLSFTEIIFVLIITIVFLILVAGRKEIKRKRIILTFSGLLLGSFAYIGILFLSYLFIFSEREALILASYHRYISSYITGVLIFLLFFLIIKTKEKFTVKKHLISTNLTLILSIVVIFCTINYINEDIKTTVDSKILNARQSVANGKSFRSQYNMILSWTRYLEDREKRLYIISQGDYGVDKLILMHTIYPSNIEWISDYSVSTTEYHPPQDIFTKIISPEDWGEYVLENYDLLYIQKYDDNFFQLYGRFFDNVQVYQLYKVKTDKEGKLKLISLPM